MRFLAVIFCIVMAFPAFAAVDKKVEQKKQNVESHSADIQKIEQYLNGITTLAAPFIQEDSEGTKAEGMFYLSRPGKLRWDYYPPTPILIVAKGSLVAYYDKELDEVSHVSLDDTLAGFLTRPKISFGDDGVKVLNFEKKTGEIRITISQNNKEEQGNLTMIFDEKVKDLVRMEVIDSIGKTTIVQFQAMVYNKELDKDLFVLPRVKTKKRN